MPKTDDRKRVSSTAAAALEEVVEKESSLSSSLSSSEVGVADRLLQKEEGRAATLAMVSAFALVMSSATSSAGGEGG